MAKIVTRYADGMLRLICPHCRQRVKLRPEWIERKGNCPHCAAALTPLTDQQVGQLSEQLSASAFLDLDASTEFVESNQSGPAACERIGATTAPAASDAPVARSDCTIRDPAEAETKSRATQPCAPNPAVKTDPTGRQTSPVGGAEPPRSFDAFREWLGIAIDGPPDHYQLLGLMRFIDDRAAIEMEYRRRAREVKNHALGARAAECQDLLDQLACAVLCLTDHARKGEYDRGLGRPESELLPANRCSVDQVLIAWNAATASDLCRARGLADELGISLRNAICQCGASSSEMASRALAQAEGLPFLDGELPALASVVARVPRELVLKHRVFPIAIDQGQLIIACPDPEHVTFEDSFQLALGLPVRLAVATPQAIRAAIDRYYMPHRRQESDGRPLVVSRDRNTSLQLPAHSPTVTSPDHPASNSPNRADSRRSKIAARVSTLQILFWTFLHFSLRPAVLLLLLVAIVAGIFAATRSRTSTKPAPATQPATAKPFPVAGTTTVDFPAPSSDAASNLAPSSTGEGTP